MSMNEISILATQLVRLRRNLAAEAPHSPSWAATSAWVDEVEDTIRSLGLDPDAVAVSERWLADRPSPRQIA